MVCKFLASILFVFATNIYAGCDTKACTGSVDKIYVNESKTYIKIGADMQNLNCTLVSGTYMTLRNDHGNRDLIFSMLLAAQASKNAGVTVRISEGTSDCKINYVTTIP